MAAPPPAWGVSAGEGLPPRAHRDEFVVVVVETCDVVVRLAVIPVPGPRLVRSEMDGPDAQASGHAGGDRGARLHLRAPVHQGLVPPVSDEPGRDGEADGQLVLAEPPPGGGGGGEGLA